MKRTCGNGTLRKENAGQEVTLIGWTARRRNLGSLVFVDLRDRSGICQIVFDETMADSAEVKEIRTEYILQVTGTVQIRKDSNPKMATGDIEVHASSVNIINTADTTPIAVADDTDALEDTRLKYRYLDLRRPVLQKNLMLRHEICMTAREYLDSLGFIEVETPMLGRQTPEGARDYLVPSRIYNGKFWALPQSPQIYKQLLMIAGMEKYFQIARCFRDEDLRSDRQPEFTQIDIEMSFIDEEDIFATVEGLMQKIFKRIKNTDLEQHFQRITWHECMNRFGTDKPDLRFGNELHNISDIFSSTEFKVFHDVLQSGGRVEALKFENAADRYSRKDLDKLQDFAKTFGAKALAYLKYSQNTLSGSIAKVLSEQEKADIISRLALQEDDLVLVVADREKTALSALGGLRIRLAHELDRIPHEQIYKFAWITEFPMFEYSEQEQRYVAAHHPFTAPKEEDVDKLMSDPEHVLSRAYDLVLNGYELLSGSIRIHDQALQEKVFESIGLTMEQAKERFGFFLEAFKYGTPPHGGVGIGLERLSMVLAGTDNIRDVVAFPTTNSSMDLMSESPNTVDKKLLDILGIEISKKDSE